MAITDWSLETRPRERLLSHGAAALNDAELVALFLRTGIKGKTAVDIAHELLTAFGGLRGIISAEQSAFCAHAGLGPAKFASLQAVLEMARRAVQQNLKETNVLSSPSAVNEYLRFWLRDKPYEIFAVLFLDSQNRLIKAQEMFRGTVTQTAVYPREVVKQALQLNACAVVLAHNHPSGCAEPSRADLHLTSALKQALGIVDIQVCDHVIVAGPTNYSFAANGTL